MGVGKKIAPMAEGHTSHSKSNTNNIIEDKIK
jgi:hypothetical protein